MSATWFGVRGRTYYFAQNTLFLTVNLSQRNLCAMCETFAFMAKLLANEGIAQLQVVDDDLLEPLTKMCVECPGKMSKQGMTWKAKMTEVLQIHRQ